MKHLTTVFLFIGLLANFVASEAWASASGDACATDPRSQKRAHEFTQELRISLAQGDVVTMSNLVGKNYEGWLSQCNAPTLTKLCGFECLLNIGDFYLFMSNEIAYYYARANNSSSSPAADKLEIYVDRGLEVVEKGKSILRQPGLAGDDSSVFRGYILNSTRFDILRVRLLMASGDNWYQSMSEQRIRRLNHLIDEALDVPQDSSKLPANVAAAKYQEALWTLSEAFMSLPDNNEFNSFESDLRIIESEINRRLTSLERGFLYLNIDPDATSFQSVSEIRKSLEEVISKINEIEGKVEAMLKEWLTIKGDQATKKLDEQARRGELSISLSTYKIAQIENDASLATTKIDEKKNAIAAAISQYNLDTNKLQSQFDLTSKKIETQFELQKRVLEMKNRIALLEGKKEIDVLDFNQGKIVRDIENLKWLMNWEIAETNLKLQEKSFEAQDIQYERELERNTAQARQLRSQMQQIQNGVAELDLQLKNNGTDMVKLTLQQKDVETAYRDAAVQNICINEFRLSRLGGKQAEAKIKRVDACKTVFSDVPAESSHRDKICAEQRKLSNAQEDYQEKALKCVIGVDGMPRSVKTRIDSLSHVSCPAGMDDQYTILKEIMRVEESLDAAEFAAVDAKIKARQNLLHKIKKHLGVLKQDGIGSYPDLSAETEKALVNAWLPDGSTCDCDKAPRVNIKEAIARANKLTKDIQNGKYKSLSTQKAAELTAREMEIEELLDAEKEQNMKNIIKALTRQKAVSDLFGEALLGNEKLKEYRIQKGLTALECDQKEAQLQTEIGLLIREHRRLLIELDAKDKAARSFDLDLSKLRIEQERLALQKDTMGLRLEELEVQLDALKKDSERITALVDINKKNKDQVIAMMSRLDGQEADAANKERALEEINKLRASKILALNEAEANQVQDVINLDTSLTQKLADSIEKSMALISTRIDGQKALEAVDFGLKQELTNLVLAMNKSISAEREVIFNQIKVAADNQSKRSKIFVMTQDEIAQMMRSVPFFITAKRRLVEEANTYLNLLRNKVSSLIPLAGDHMLASANPEGLFYVRTAHDMQSAAKLAVEKFWTNPDPTSKFKYQINYDIKPIPFSGALLETVRNKRRVRFEISPFARSPLEKVAGQSFTIGSSLFPADQNFAKGNHVIIDMFFRVHFSQNLGQCRPPNSVILRHEGSGYVFRPVTQESQSLAPMMVSGAPRYYVTNSFSEQIEGSKESLKRRLDSWDGRTLDLISFDKKLDEDASRNIYPLVGLPLISTYELILPRVVYQNLDGVLFDCDYSEVELFVVYSYSADIT